MICIITGDIIGSRRLKDDWLSGLKNALKYLTSQDNKWEIFRGDSFQAEVKPADALTAVIYIKACIRVTKQADVRMGIGIGGRKGRARKLSESTGDAFIFSGEAFDSLKQNKTSLSLKTNSEDFDYELNTSIRLALVAMDNWGPATAEVVKLAMESADSVQQELAERSGRTQSSISEALKRAHYAEILELDRLYRKKLQQLIKPHGDLPA